MRPAATSKRRPGAKSTAETAELRKAPETLGKAGDGNCGTTAEELRKHSHSSSLPALASPSAPSLVTTRPKNSRKGSPAGTPPDAGDSDELLALWAQFEASPAALTGHQVEAIEARFNDPEVGLTRRVALAMLTKSGPELIRMALAKDGRELLAELTDCTGDLAAHFEGLAELLRTAELRGKLAHCAAPDRAG